MTIETKDGFVEIFADEGRAIHRIGTSEPSGVVGTRFPVGRYDVSEFEDCDLGEPEREALETDKDAALRRFGVEV